MKGQPQFKTNMPTADLQTCTLIHFWIYLNRMYRFDAKSAEVKNR